MSAQNVKINSQLRVFYSSQCSCLDCDTTGCFIKRREADKCSCEKCRGSNTCIFFSNKMANMEESISNLCNSVKITNGIKSTENRPIIARESLEKERYIDNKINKQVLTQTQSEYYLKHFPPPETEIDETCEPQNNELPIDPNPTPVTHAVNFSRSDISPSTAKLSAQIMNVDSILFKKSVRNDKSFKLSKFDILNRIKEAYKACSCKVCDCIASLPLPTQNEICQCKPCDCDDCRRMKYKLKDKSDKSTHKKSCNCLVCTKEKCVGFNKTRTTKCDCRPCGCMECVKNMSKVCDCEPCQCIDCKLRAFQSTIIVAPVGENNTRAVCVCSPCQCMECGNVYGTIARNVNITHEMSTGMSRPRNCPCETCLNEACDLDGSDMCRCEGRDKLMRKPVQRDTNDYDIRSALISNTNPTIYGECSTSDKRNTIAMFATLSNTYPKVPIIRNSKSCNFTDCNCVNCKYKEHISSTYKTSNECHCTNKVLNSQNAGKSCKCSPCECEICATHNDKTDFHLDNCKCDGRDSINCKKFDIPSCSDQHNIDDPNKMSPEGPWIYQSCDFVDCQKEMMRCTGGFGHCDRCKCDRRFDKHNNKVIYPMTKDELLQLYDLIDRLLSKREDLRECKRNSKKKSNHSYISRHSGQDVYIYAYPQYCNSFMENTNNNAVESIHLTDDPKKKTILTYETDDNYKTKVMKTNKEMECQVSESYISAMSSCGTSRLSDVNGSDTPSLSRKHAPKSSEQSSCNSSGHDYSDYLIRFPRTTAETCINDVMKSNLDNKLIFNRLHDSPVASPENDTKRSFKVLNNCFKQKNSLKEIGDIYRIDRHTYSKIQYTSGKLCHCNPCNWDKCSFSKLKLKRCDCDCIACNCFGGCLSENQSILIRKSQDTQTDIKTLQDRGQDSLDRNKSASAMDRFNEQFIKLNTQLYPLLPNPKELEVTKDGDISRLNFSNFCYHNTNINNNKRDNSFFDRKHLIKSYNSNDALFNLPIQINYESVQNTIKEARAFSIDLLQILEKYEKANSEFESVSEKIKISQDVPLVTSISSKNTKNVSYVKATREENEGEIQNRDIFSKSSHEIKINYCENHQKEMSREAICDLNVPEVDNNENKYEEKNIENTTMYSQITTNDMGNTKDELKTTISEISTNRETDRKTFSDYIFEAVCKKIYRNQEETEYKNRYRMYRKLIKRAVSLSRKFNSNTSSPNESQCNSMKTDSRKVEDFNKIIHLIVPTKEVKGMEVEHINNGDLSEEKQSDLISEKSDALESIHYDDGLIIINNSTSTVEAGRIKDRFMQEQERQDSKETTSCPITMKNFFLDTQFMKPRSKQPSLEVEMKETVKIISMQASNNPEPQFTYPIPRFGNKALAYLQVEVNKLLNMPQLQTQNEAQFPTKTDQYSTTTTTSQQDLDFINSRSITTSLNNYRMEPTINKDITSSRVTRSMVKLRHDLEDYANLPPWPLPPKQLKSKINLGNDLKENAPLVTSKSSCDGMKISFYGVRRVSDHTILVKWNPPRETKDIQGYELLVDGRAVQKILSPSRCMAVVTCLPHNDKVLLTIRTITVIAHNGHFPSTTIVYRPRVK